MGRMRGQVEGRAVPPPRTVPRPMPSPFPFAAARARPARPCRRSRCGTRTGSIPSPSSGTARSRAPRSPCFSAPSSSTRAHRLLRLKGFVEIAEAPGRPVTVNGAGHVFEPAEPRPGGWPDTDRRSRLVLIGEGISAPWCERLLDALAAEVREAAERFPRPRT